MITRFNPGPFLGFWGFFVFTVGCYTLYTKTYLFERVSLLRKLPMKSIPTVSEDIVSSFNHSIERDIYEYVMDSTAQLSETNPELYAQIVSLCQLVFRDNELMKNIIINARTPGLVDVALDEIYKKAIVIILCVLGMVNSQIEANEIKDLFK